MLSRSGKNQFPLGCTDELTAEFISNRTGEVSVAVSSQAKQLNTWRVSDYTPEYRETHSIGKRTLHPESKKLKESRASDHIPQWRKNPETPEPDFSKLMKPQPKPRKAKAPKKTPSPEAATAQEPDFPKDPPAFFPTDEDCGIVMTDKKSIMS